MYKSGLPPIDVSQLPEFIRRELNRLEEELYIAKPLTKLAITYVAPLKPQDGELRYADGTKWNPGAGEGFYGYENGAWVKL